MRGLIRLSETCRSRGSVPMMIARAMAPPWVIDAWAGRGFVVVDARGYVSVTEAGVVAARAGSAGRGDVVRRLLSAQPDDIPGGDVSSWVRGLSGPHWPR